MNRRISDLVVTMPRRLNHHIKSTQTPLHPALRVQWMRTSPDVPFNLIISKVEQDGTVTDLVLTEAEAQYISALVLTNHEGEKQCAM